MYELSGKNLERFINSNTVCVYTVNTTLDCNAIIPSPPPKCPMDIVRILNELFHYTHTVLPFSFIGEKSALVK